MKPGFLLSGQECSRGKNGASFVSRSLQFPGLCFQLQFVTGARDVRAENVRPVGHDVDDVIGRRVDLQPGREQQESSGKIFYQKLEMTMKDFIFIDASRVI